MEELLHGFLENNSVPFVSAIALGLLTAISPCPLATNITPIGLIIMMYPPLAKVRY